VPPTLRLLWLERQALPTLRVTVDRDAALEIWRHDASECQRELARQWYDAVVVDRTIRGREAATVCRQVKGLRADVPVLVLADATDMAQAATCGADRVLGAALSMPELSAAIRRLRPRPP
jgi:DNA-binding response OmpR family regulator